VSYQPGMWGGFGPGRRIVGQETPATETVGRLKLALMGTVAAEAGITCILLMCSILQWSVFPMSAILIGTIYWLVSVKVAAAKSYDDLGSRARAIRNSSMRGIALGLAVVIAGLVAGFPLWSKISYSIGGVRGFIPCLVAPFEAINRYVWAGMVVVPCIARFWGSKVSKTTVIVEVGLLAAWWIVQVRSTYWCTRSMTMAWPGLRLLLIPYLLPPLVFSVGIVMASWIESLIGSVWPPTYNNVDLSSVGIMGMLFPRLLIKKPQEPEYVEEVAPEPQLDVMVQNPNPKPGEPAAIKTTLIRPKRKPNGLEDFALDILAGRATFSERGAERANKTGARDYGYTQKEWGTLRRVWIKAKLADDMGGGKAEPSAYGYAILEGLVARRFGPEAVPVKPGT
jgi:hypothetical protein